jgi:predicted Zn-dependent protease
MILLSNYSCVETCSHTDAKWKPKNMKIYNEYRNYFNIDQTLDYWNSIQDYFILEEVYDESYNVNIKNADFKKEAASVYFDFMSCEEDANFGIIRAHIFIDIELINSPQYADIENEVFSTTIIHEIGHILGLQHNSSKESCMYTAPNIDCEILQDDLDKIREIHGDN